MPETKETGGSEIIRGKKSHFLKHNKGEHDRIWESIQQSKGRERKSHLKKGKKARGKKNTQKTNQRNEGLSPRGLPDRTWEGQRICDLQDQRTVKSTRREESVNHKIGTNVSLS